MTAMTIISWNCQELETPRIIRDLSRLVKEKKPTLVFLMETKFCQKKLKESRCKLGYHGLFMVDCIWRSGVLMLLWDSETVVEIQNFSQHHINAVIKDPTNEAPWKLTGIMDTW
jgi:exonuclease III